MATPYQIGLTVVIAAVAGTVPRVVVVPSRFDLPQPLRGNLGADNRTGEHRDALPGAPFEPERYRTLQDGVRGVAEGLSGLVLRYVEQLYTFGDRYRDPHELFGGPRSLTIGYLALVQDAPLVRAPGATWRNLYDYFPWEDWREAKPAVIDRVIVPELGRWVAAAPDPGMRDRRSERVGLAFRLNGGAWDAERVLERYELLYEAGLVAEAGRDSWLRRCVAGTGLAGTVEPADLEPADQGPGADGGLGRPMVRDGRRILATALERLRGKLRYRPIVFELLPPVFTLNQVQQVVEALTGDRLHKQNFRRLLIADGLVEATGQWARQTGGRPAELYRFRRQAIHERTSTGAIPGAEER